MKKALIGVLFCFFIGTSIFAQEVTSEQDISKMSFGGGIFSDAISSGGFADFSFHQYRKNNFNLRNHLVLLFGALGDTPGAVVFSWRISTGYKLFDLIRPYIYIDNGIGAWGDNNKNGFFDLPVMYCIGAGGGMDVFINEMFSVFVEPQWIGYYSTDNFNRNSFQFRIGWKGYF